MPNGMEILVNIQDDIIRLHSIGVLELLLADKTTGNNILWATEAYADHGPQYSATSEIMAALITGESNIGIIRTRARKVFEQQSERTKQRAEVFTPQRVCKIICDTIDEVWFRRKSGFYKTQSDTGKISFPSGRTWKQYVQSRRMEIACGEGPFIVSRYDAVSGELLPMEKRIGMLDRKLRVVNENSDNEAEWIAWSEKAFQSVYGFELQGDNLLIARVNLMMTFVEYLLQRWNRHPSFEEYWRIANIITWNLWQMNGITGKSPAINEDNRQLSLFEDKTEPPPPCRIFNWRQHGSTQYLDVNRGKNRMKFDYVIGNPPYQQEDGGAGASASPLYNKFIEEIKKQNPDVISFIIPAKWYSGGKGLNEFRRSMLNDRHICRLIDWTDSQDCFPNVDVAGGVCVFVRKRSYEGDCLYTNYYHGRESTIKRDLSEFETFIRYPAAVEIIKKIRSLHEPTMDTVVTSRKPFGLSTNVKPTADGDITLRYNKGSGPYKRNNVSAGTDMIDKYKVMISYLTAEHAGQPDKSGKFRVLSTMEILPPQWICTETYLIAGCFDAESEAINAIKYLKTKFVRFLVAQKAVSQHITKDCFSFVPIQDFKLNYDDVDLYAKYSLNQNEINYIEAMIKEMT